MKLKLLILAVCLLFISLAVADVVSFNSGGGNSSIISSGGGIEGFFSQANRLPIVLNVLLLSTSGNNLTSDNLTVTYSSSDADGNAVTNITDWRLDGSSIAVLNMPFDKNVAELTTGAVRDYSTYGNNGTLGDGTVSARPTWNSSCRVGGCYEFDSNDDYISLTGLDVDTSAGAKNTVSFWMYWEGGSSEMPFGFSSYDLWFLSGCFGFNTGQGNVFGMNSAGLSGSWKHVAAVFYNGVPNSTSNVLYIDGVGQTIFSCAGTTSASRSATTTARISGWPSGGSNSFGGKLDEFLIFPYELSNEQIRVIYDAGVAGHQVEKVVSQETAKGDSWQVALTPNDKIMDGATVMSNVLSIDDSTPEDPTDVTLVSLNGRNESDANLNCSAYIMDVDDTTLSVYVNWLKDSSSVLNQTFTSQTNGTTFSTQLESGNLTLGDTWMCSVRTNDGNSYSDWVDSNNLTIIDITSPNVTIISPNSTYNYTTLDVDFNISVIDDENVSMCLYELDGDANVTMTEVNDTYFWYEPSLGPGPHDLVYYCNDTSNNWGTNSTNFTIDNSAAISILLSNNLTDGVRWNILALPANDLDALGNNGAGATLYYLNISATNTLVDLYVKADGNLITDTLDTLGLGNETYSVNTTDPTVSNSQVLTMTTNYSLIGGSLGDGSVIYMKFYLDAPSSQAAGIYLNQLQFKAVRDGETP